MAATDPDPITLEDIPQGACSSCGSRVYKAEMLERIEAVFKSEPHDPGMSTFAL